MSENSRQEPIDYFEHGQLIYPESIEYRPDDNAPEIPVRQYNLVKLRTWYRFDRAEGRLQVTNKRVLFRATGKSLHGKTVIQNEFSIAEIGGIDIRKGTILNKSYLIISIIALIAMIIISVISSISAAINSFSYYSFSSSYGQRRPFSYTPFGIFVIIVLLIFALTTIKFPGDRGVKLLAAFLALGLGNRISFWIALIVTIYAILRFINRPNIAIIIKSKGATMGVDIRRASGTEHKEFTGFDEVVPWEDAEAAIRELGALIDDIKDLGEIAIPKWQDAQSKALTPMRDSTHIVQN